MQHKVQKSKSTILPFKSLREIGFEVFSQADPPTKSGAGIFVRAALSLPLFSWPLTQPVAIKIAKVNAINR